MATVITRPWQVVQPLSCSAYSWPTYLWSHTYQCSQNRFIPHKPSCKTLTSKANRLILLNTGSLLLSGSRSQLTRGLVPWTWLTKQRKLLMEKLLKLKRLFPWPLARSLQGTLCQERRCRSRWCASMSCRKNAVHLLEIFFQTNSTTYKSVWSHALAMLRAFVELKTR